MTVEQRLRESLRQPLEGDGETQQRAWRVVSAAAPAPRSRGIPVLARWKPLAAVCAGLVALAVALTPPGDAVSDWVRNGLGIDGSDGPAARASLSLPTGGRLLVTVPRGTWVVRRDGSRRRIGGYAEASWSPNGLFAVAGTGRQLVALTPAGEVRWARTGSGVVSGPRWAPSGLRIAYLSGPSLRTVTGAGQDDRELEGRVAPVAPAWRPDGEDEVAYVDDANRVVLASAVTRQVLWRSLPGRRPFALAWSHDGTRLATASRTGVRLLDARGRVVGRSRPPRGAQVNALGFSPRGRRLAVIERRVGESAVVLVSTSGATARKRIFSGVAPLEDLAWSPNGRWILVTSPRADQWLFLRTRAPSEVVARSAVAAQLDPGRGAGEFPRLAGWCCGR